MSRVLLLREHYTKILVGGCGKRRYDLIYYFSKDASFEDFDKYFFNEILTDRKKKKGGLYRVDAFWADSLVEEYSDEEIAFMAQLTSVKGGEEVWVTINMKT